MIGVREKDKSQEDEANGYSGMFVQQKVKKEEERQFREEGRRLRRERQICP